MTKEQIEQAAKNNLDDRLVNTLEGRLWVKGAEWMQSMNEEELKKMTEDRDCAVQAFQDTLSELNKLKDNYEELKEKRDEIFEQKSQLHPLIEAQDEYIKIIERRFGIRIQDMDTRLEQAKKKIEEARK